MSALKLLTLAMLIQISIPALAQEFKLEFGLIIKMNTVSLLNLSKLRRFQSRIQVQVHYTVWW